MLRPEDYQEAPVPSAVREAMTRDGAISDACPADVELEGLAPIPDALRVAMPGRGAGMPAATAGEIRRLCQQARRSDLAEMCINAGMSPDDVRQLFIEVGTG